MGWSCYKFMGLELIEIICCDEEKAHRGALWNRRNNLKQEIQKTFLGGVLNIDRRLGIPDGFIVTPPKGTSIDSLRHKHQKLYNKLKEMGVVHF
jgi:hypothetical protein